MDGNFFYVQSGWLARLRQRQKEMEFITANIVYSFTVTHSVLRNLFFPFRSNEDVIALGREIDEYGQEKNVIGIPDSLLRVSVHVMGGSGRGKTTLLSNISIQLMLLNRSIVIIDPKGDLIDTVMHFIPADRMEDVIVFDPTDRKYPLAFNIFESVPVSERSRVAGEILLIFKKITALGSWGPRLESALRLAILALLEVPGSTLLDLYYFLTDENYRLALLEKVSDAFVKEYWVKQFANMSSSQKDQAINPILNKIEPWLAYPEARFVLGQANSSFSLREAIDSGKIVLVSIPQGILGEDLSSLIGALVVTKLQMEVMSRASVPFTERRRVHLLIDEFQNFTTNSFEKILSEARSYGLSILCANQHAAQLAPELLQSLESNCSVRLRCELEHGRHLLVFELLQDINKPELLIRPLKPPKDGSQKVAQSVRYLSQLKYGTEIADVAAQLSLKHQIRTQHAQLQPIPTPQLIAKQPAQALVAKPPDVLHQQPEAMTYGRRKKNKAKTP